MGAKPMMLASRGKKSLVAIPTAREFFEGQDGDGNEAEGGPAPSYWIVADERLPIVAVRLQGVEEERKRR